MPDLLPFVAIGDAASLTVMAMVILYIVGHWLIAGVWPWDLN